MHVVLQDAPPVYDLFAISQHYGSLGGGHYTATCRYEDGDWYSFNDSSVDRLDAMDPQDSARSAYVLFYRRQQDFRQSPSETPFPSEPASCELRRTGWSLHVRRADGTAVTTSAGCCTSSWRPGARTGCVPPAGEAGAAAVGGLGQEDREMEDADESADISIVGSPNADRTASESILGGAAANGNGFLRGYEHVPAVPCTAREGAVQDVVVSDDTSAGGPFIVPRHQ